MSIDTAPDPQLLHPLSALVIAALAFVLLVLGMTLVMTNGAIAPAPTHVVYTVPVVTVTETIGG